MAENCPFWKHGRCVPPRGDENQCSYRARDYDNCVVYKMVSTWVQTGSALQGMITAGVIAPGTFVAGHGIVQGPARSPEKPATTSGRLFPRWDYQAVQELERICMTLPILPRETALRFFRDAEKATATDVRQNERQSGQVFESLMGVVNASDRKDFSIAIQAGAGRIPAGLLMLETYDRTIGVMFCVARVSETSFLTWAFLERSKAALKALRDEAAPDASSSRGNPWWAFWR
jgi:hypothetical protein